MQAVWYASAFEQSLHSIITGCKDAKPLWKESVYKAIAWYFAFDLIHSAEQTV